MAFDTIMWCTKKSFVLILSDVVNLHVYKPLLIYGNPWDAQQVERSECIVVGYLLTIKAEWPVCRIFVYIYKWISALVVSSRKGVHGAWRSDEWYKSDAKHDQPEELCSELHTIRSL